MGAPLALSPGARPRSARRPLPWWAIPTSARHPAVLGAVPSHPATPRNPPPPPAAQRSTAGAAGAAGTAARSTARAPGLRRPALRPGVGPCRRAAGGGRRGSGEAAGGRAGGRRGGPARGVRDAGGPDMPALRHGARGGGRAWRVRVSPPRTVMRASAGGCGFGLGRAGGRWPGRGGSLGRGCKESAFGVGTLYASLMRDEAMTAQHIVRSEVRCAGGGAGAWRRGCCC